MHTVWSGDIAFGLVTIPAKLYSATRDLTPKFHLVHKGCGTRIQMVRRCPKCQKDLAWEDIDKAYEVSKGEYAPVTKEELTEAESQDAKGIIEIVEFVKPAEVDLAYIDQSYWIGPSGKNGNSFTLLRTVLERSGLVALTKVAIRTRLRLALLRPRDQYFSLDMMRFADELVPATFLVMPPAKSPSDKELKLAQTLVDQLTGRFDPETHPDEYRARIEALVEEKVENHQTLQGEVSSGRRDRAGETNNVVDLSELLARSLKLQKGPGPAKSGRARGGKDEVAVKEAAPAVAATKKKRATR